MGTFIRTSKPKLNLWRHKYISLGGRVVLINSVLNSIPIFLLSFMKMPVLVWRKIFRIQREFLWGGVGGHKEDQLGEVKVSLPTEGKLRVMSDGCLGGESEFIG